MSYLLCRFVTEYLRDGNDTSSIQACVLEVQEAFALDSDQAQSAVNDVLSSGIVL